MTDGDPEVIFNLKTREPSLEGPLLLILTHLQLPITLPDSLLLRRGEVPQLLFGPTRGPATDPGLVRPGASLAKGEGAEGNSPRKRLPSPRMGKARGLGGQGYYDSRTPPQFPEVSHPSIDHLSFSFSPDLQGSQQQDFTLYSRLVKKGICQRSWNPFLFIFPGCLRSPNRTEESGR